MKNIENLKLKEDILKLKSKVNSYRYDKLTGLKTRNDLEWDFKDLLSKQVPFIVHLCDINNLKEINTALGYIEGGDKAIQETAEKLKTIFDHNLIYRIGGDEFLVFDFNMQNYFDTTGKLTVISKKIVLGNCDKVPVCDLNNIISNMDKKMIKLKTKGDKARSINHLKNNAPIYLNIPGYQMVTVIYKNGVLVLTQQEEETIIILKEEK